MNRGRRPSSKSPAAPPRATPGPGSLTLPWGLPDCLGFTVAVSMVVWWPWPTGTTSLLALTILTVSTLACLPWVLMRWREGGRPRGLSWLPVGAAIGLVTWAIASALFSGMPLPVAVYGWSGRQDGLLALCGVAVLLAAGAVLRHDEIDRLFTWLLLGGAVMVIEALGQQAGWTAFRTSEIPGVWAAMGNPNFLAAMCGLLSALVLGRLLDARFAAWQRAAAGALLIGLMTVSVLSLSTQGPVTVAIALAAVLALRLVQWRSPHRLAVTVGIAVLGAAGLVVTAIGLQGSGPLAMLWAGESTGFRKDFWNTAWRIMNGLPVLGTGPDGLARYVGEYRTEQYIAGQGPDLYVDAAHNVPLQYGATIGYPGLILWLLLFVGALGLVVVAAWKRTGPPWLVASIGGLLVVYFFQAMISIDDLRLKEMGWLAAGLAVAVCASRTTAGTEHRPTTGTRVTSAALGVAGLLVCAPVLIAVWSASAVENVEQASASATHALVPWDRRMELLTGMGQVLDLESTWAVGARVGALDPRGPGQAASLAELAVLAGDVSTGLQLAQLAVDTDAKSPRAWLAYSFALRSAGRAEDAEAAFAEASRLQAIWPLPDWRELVDAQTSGAKS